MKLSSLIDALIAAGGSVEQIQAVVRASETEQAERRAKVADIKRRQRAALRSDDQVHQSPPKSNGLDRTAEDLTGHAETCPSPTKESPHTPKKTTPSNLTSFGDKSARATRFSEFWSAYPKREGSNPKQPAEEKFLRLLRASSDPEILAQEITDGARRYAILVAGADPKFTAQAVTWLNQGRWKDERVAIAPPAANGARAGPAQAKNRPPSMFDATIDFMAELHDKHH